MLKESKAEYNYRYAHYRVTTYRLDGKIVSVGLFPDLKAAYRYITYGTRIYPGITYQITNALGIFH